jgi:hypothetical protein
MDAGFRAITGGVGVDVVVVGVVGVSNWVKPGIDEDSLFIPRPLSEVPPWFDDVGAATADTEVEAVGLGTAPANDRDVDGDVVVIDVVFA